MRPRPPRNIRLHAPGGPYDLDSTLAYLGVDKTTRQHRWVVYGPLHLVFGSADELPDVSVGTLPGRTTLTLPHYVQRDGTVRYATPSEAKDKA